ncbi:MAG TPA: hypothetical protein VFU31_08795, partial [Candidatus Binatia bacterium]|nr:hypothetical protein [Candidatus Binatia bacterium]
VGNYTCEGQSCNNIDPDPNTGSGTQTDPFASLTAPTPQGSCIPSPPSGANPVTLYPGRYCTGIKIEGVPSARFEPGVYYVENGFRITSEPVVTGTGVFFYIASGQLKIDGGANVTFSASTSGDYKGFVFFQSRTNTTPVILTGGTGMNINGAVYALGAALDYAGGNCTTSPPKTMIVADTIHFVGESCIGRPDDAFLASASQVVLAE